jgi:bacillithiol biosynthesis deacetylase BshB1
MKLDVLAFAAHPDDIELACGGTIAKLVQQGKKVGIVDLTEGELGSRGSVDLRYEEAANSAKILGVSVRENLRLRDGFFQNDEESKLKVIEQIRRFQPEIVIANSITDRHPDHGRASKLISESFFLSGLRKIKTHWECGEQEAYRPKVLYKYIQDYYIKPDFIVDVTNHFETKMEAVLAFKSQFYDPNSTEPETPISGKGFLDFLKARAEEFGRPIGAKYGEGFTTERVLGVENLFDLR